LLSEIGALSFAATDVGRPFSDFTSKDTYRRNALVSSPQAIGKVSCGSNNRLNRNKIHLGQFKGLHLQKQ
jgi:hypothetical protein